ncbi:hypothetical protein BH688_10800 [Kushneria phosphatilytica]|nr:hypothetical protein BH688_10800 [Kushneria phosphatilytica]
MDSAGVIVSPVISIRQRALHLPGVPLAAVRRAIVILHVPGASALRWRSMVGIVAPLLMTALAGIIHGVLHLSRAGLSFGGRRVIKLPTTVRALLALIERVIHLGRMPLAPCRRVIVELCVLIRLAGAALK